MYRAELVTLWASPYPDSRLSTLTVTLILTGVIIILWILIKRGKGGGMAGAFGAAGGSSAFGSRAGDQFTRITLITALIWVLLIMLLAKMAPDKGVAPTPSAPAGGQPEARLHLPDVEH